VRRYPRDRWLVGALLALATTEAIPDLFRLGLTIPEPADHEVGDAWGERPDKRFLPPTIQEVLDRHREQAGETDDWKEPIRELIRSISPDGGEGFYAEQARAADERARLEALARLGDRPPFDYPRIWGLLRRAQNAGGQAERLQATVSLALLGDA